MFKIVPFKFEHVGILGDAMGEMLIPPTTAVQLEQHQSFTGLTEEGEVVGCAGVVKIWPRRWMAWAHVNRKLIHANKRQMVKEVRKFLHTLGPGRVEASIVHDNYDHIRFANACGFTVCEAPYMEKYLPNGEHAALWTRIT